MEPCALNRCNRILRPTGSPYQSLSTETYLHFFSLHPPLVVKIV